MRKLILFISCMLSIVYCYAGYKGAYVSNNASIYNITVTSTTSKALYTLTSEQGFERIKIDNQSGYTMYLSTYSANSVQAASMYPIPSSTDITKPLPTFESTGFTHVISTAGTPSCSGIYILIEK